MRKRPGFARIFTFEKVESLSGIISTSIRLILVSSEIEFSFLLGRC